jgi:vancomycin resistance protein VanW
MDAGTSDRACARFRVQLCNQPVPTDVIGILARCKEAIYVQTKWTPKPRLRSFLRMQVGVTYFRLKRYLSWLLSKQRWARTFGAADEFGHEIITHQTPLMRQLKNVDMWLQRNKVTNLRLATAHLHGLVLRPGETLSYWRAIGNPTARRGYVAGLELHNGQMQVGVAGGLCQLSNLLYWMTLHTPLTVVERWRHNFDVFPDSDRILPFGSGATCFYNYVDLVIRNDTDQPFYLELFLTESHLVGRWRSNQPTRYDYKVYEAEHQICAEPWGGYTRHNVLRRRLFAPGGEQVDDQFVVANDALMMYQPLLAPPQQPEQQSPP